MSKADASQAVGFQAAVTDWTGRYKPLRADGESYVAMWFWEHGYAAGERAGEADALADRLALGTDWHEALEAAVEQAVAEERARIVAWLRSQNWMAADTIADEIEQP